MTTVEITWTEIWTTFELNVRRINRRVLDGLLEDFRFFLALTSNEYVSCVSYSIYQLLRYLVLFVGMFLMSTFPSGFFYIIFTMAKLILASEVSIHNHKWPLCCASVYNFIRKKTALAYFSLHLISTLIRSKRNI